MAIQGIIEGFADPSNTHNHVVVLGRGDHYVKVVNGTTQGGAWDDVGAALDELKKTMRGLKRDHWVEVRGVTTFENGESKVATVGTKTYSYFHPDEATAAPAAKTAGAPASAPRRPPLPRRPPRT